MDEFTLGKGIQALQWEANYRKKIAVDKSVSNHFLTPDDNLDSDFEKQLSLLNITKGRVLDIGTGTGEQTASDTADDASPDGAPEPWELAGDATELVIDLFGHPQPSSGGRDATP